MQESGFDGRCAKKPERCATKKDGGQARAQQRACQARALFLALPKRGPSRRITNNAPQWTGFPILGQDGSHDVWRRESFRDAGSRNAGKRCRFHRARAQQLERQAHGRDAHDDGDRVAAAGAAYCSSTYATTARTGPTTSERKRQSCRWPCNRRCRLKTWKARSAISTALRARASIQARGAIHADGALFAAYSETPETTPSRSSAGHRAGHLLGDGRVELVKPVVQGSETLGTIYLRARYDISGRVRAYFSVLGGVMVIGLVAAVLASSWLHAWSVSQP